ncbi:MAG: ABC transporter ATP-binding protein [Candidatus Hydrogenedentes bacterium]|nr:ABC transporter ATP-binding protein [Candidatus Hydrogenedentota bacterium]
MPTCISLNNLTKHYGSTVAVKNLTLKVEEGEVLGLLGPNGAGKSTTLYMLAGLVRPDEGKINVFGRELQRNFVSIARRMGVLVERPVFYDYLSVRRNLKLFARLAGHDVNVDRLLDLVGLLHAGNARAGALSQGMRQRLGLAHAMLTEPELLLLDEPTAGLDLEGVQDILQLLRYLAKDARVTIVFSSHQMHEVESLCDRVAILNKGELVACERTDALLSYDQTSVEVLIDGSEGAAKRLSEQSWVEKVEAKPGRLQVRLREENVHQLAAFLVTGGYKVSAIMPRRRTLQDYFLKVMNQSEKGAAS